MNNTAGTLAAAPGNRMMHNRQGETEISNNLLVIMFLELIRV